MVRSLALALIALSVASCKENVAPGLCGPATASEEAVCADSAAPKASGAPSARPSASAR